MGSMGSMVCNIDIGHRRALTLLREHRDKRAEREAKYFFEAERTKQMALHRSRLTGINSIFL
jgi:hypothetical protein